MKSTLNRKLTIGGFLAFALTKDTLNPILSHKYGDFLRFSPLRSPIKGLSSRLQKISLRIFLTHFQPLATPFDMILASFRPPAHPPFRDSDEEEENSYAVSERSPCQIAAQTAALPSRQSAHLCRETAPYPSAHHLPTIKTATPSIVGYTAKEAAQGKFLIIGAQFEDVQSGKMPINGLITGVQGVDYDDNSTFVTTAAQIQIPFDGAYKTYYYLNDGYDLVKDDGTTAPGWCDGAGNLVDAEFTPGVAVWFKSVPADGSATVAGAVSDVSYKTVDCPIGFALRANTFPVTVELNTSAITSEDIVGANYDDESQFVNTAPQIQIPYDGAYRTYYYLNDGYDLVKDDGTTAPGWCDGAGNLVNTTIPAGQGFWTKGVTGTFTLKFTK